MLLVVESPTEQALDRWGLMATSSEQDTTTSTGLIRAGLHTLYYRVDGPPDGTPVFIFHGGWGPRDSDGACCEGGTDAWLVVQLHQRGWGKSTPAAELADNSPREVLADVEALRKKLRIERWIVVGGSTGAMLALLYGVEHPEAVLAVVCRGTWLLRRKEIDWCYRGGMGHFYPQEWSLFEKHARSTSELCPANAVHDPVELYWQQLQDNDALEHQSAAAEAARHWMKWDGQCGTLLPDREGQLEQDVEFAMTAAKIGTHWYRHQQQWYSDDYILDKIRSGVLAGLPVRLINGRYDLLCPPKWSYEVFVALKEGHAECDKVDIVEGAGHAGSEAGIKVRMCEVMAQLAKCAPDQLASAPDPNKRAHEAEAASPET